MSPSIEKAGALSNDYPILFACHRSRRFRVLYQRIFVGKCFLLVSMLEREGRCTSASSLLVAGVGRPGRLVRAPRAALAGVTSTRA